MSQIVNAGLDQAVAMANAAVDGALEAVDATQNAVLETGVQAAEAAEDMGDLTMANVRELGERFKATLARYAAAVKKVADATPIP